MTDADLFQPGDHVRFIGPIQKKSSSDLHIGDEFVVKYVEEHPALPGWYGLIFVDHTDRVYSIRDTTDQSTEPPYVGSVLWEKVNDE